jgi:hypothetical protein
MVLQVIGLIVVGIIGALLVLGGVGLFWVAAQLGSGSDSAVAVVLVVLGALCVRWACAVAPFKLVLVAGGAL